MSICWLDALYADQSGEEDASNAVFLTETPPSLFNVLVLNVAALMHFLIIGPFWFYMVIIWELVM